MAGKRVPMATPTMTREEFNAKLLPFLRDDLTAEQHIEVVEMREKLLAAQGEMIAAYVAKKARHCNAIDGASPALFINLAWEIKNLK